MNRIFCLFFYQLVPGIFILWFPSLNAQPLNTPDNDSLKQITVMLIPYDPLYYLSDADHDIAEQSKNDMQEVRKQFNLQSDYYTYAAIARHFTCIDLLHDTSESVQQDLVTVFSTLGYRYEEPMHINPDARKLVPNNSKKKDSNNNPVIASHYQQPAPDLKYMNAVLNKPGLIQAMSKKYGADYFVFLNQFEIKTNYNSCLDIANKVYQRTILLHFSIFDHSGRQLAGNFCYAFFPTNSSEEHEIIRSSFSELGNGISKSLMDAVYSNTVKR